jgi:hypothetical protein
MTREAVASNRPRLRSSPSSQQPEAKADRSAGHLQPDLSDRNRCRRRASLLLSTDLVPYERDGPAIGGELRLGITPRRRGGSSTDGDPARRYRHRPHLLGVRKRSVVDREDWVAQARKLSLGLIRS